MTKSPFKFLDPYTREDEKIFFGRDNEIEQLYKMVFEAGLILVYGESGTGKTSLIRCGLASRFDASDWNDILIRRKNDINTSTWKALRAAARTPIKAEATIVEAVESIFLDYFKPVFLIFDQFEELFIQGMGRAEERQQFIESIAELTRADLKCKVIFVMREEYLAKLYEFEKVLPNLFDFRLRVEPMKYGDAYQVIERTCAHLNIPIDTPEASIEEIINNISEGKSGVQLSYLQIYLDKLYQNALNN
jgi:hypothetical protein